MRHTLFRPDNDDAYSGAPLPGLYAHIRSYIVALKSGDMDQIEETHYKLVRHFFFDLIFANFLFSKWRNKKKPFQVYEIAATAMALDEVAALLRPKLLSERELEPLWGAQLSQNEQNKLLIRESTHIWKLFQTQKIRTFKSHPKLNQTQDSLKTHSRAHTHIHTQTNTAKLESS